MLRFFDRHALWIFPLVSLLVFYPTYKYGYVTDFLSWLYKYENGSWSDVWDCFDYPGLHQFFHFVNYGTFQIVGKSFFGWYLVMSFLHGLNGYWIYRWLRSMNGAFGLQMGNGFFLFVPLAFMLSPYAVEPVVWKACLHYLVSFGLIIAGLWALTEYLENRKPVWLVHLCFLLALFTLEISLAVPFIYLIYFLSHDLIRHKGLHLKRHFIWIALPQMLILVLYFLANKMMIGDWVGHYGAESHLNFDFWLMSGNAFMYVFKYLALLHYVPFKLKTTLYDFIAQPVVVMGLLTLSLAIGYWVFNAYRKGKSKFVMLAFSYLAFFMALFPISNLFFFRSQIYENDRYGYLASIFIYLFVGLLIWMLSSGWWRKLWVLLFSGLSLFCFVKTIAMAHFAGEVTHTMVDQFDYYDRAEIVMLSKYDNYGGMQMFRDLSGKAQSFTESLYHFAGKNYEGIVHDIAQINIIDRDTKVIIEQIDDNTIKVKNLNPGSWFWKDGMGLTAFEDENFKVELGSWHYKLTVKDPSVQRTFLYHEGLEWREFVFK